MGLLVLVEAIDGKAGCELPADQVGQRMTEYHRFCVLLFFLEHIMLQVIQVGIRQLVQRAHKPLRQQRRVAVAKGIFLTCSMTRCL